ncbi:MAG TPA: ATP-binding protein [Thermoanaerobaculia bacterium]|nr:ATP-binding protein [Thermoanaerobaculia bacterium]
MGVLAAALLAALLTAFAVTSLSGRQDDGGDAAAVVDALAGALAGGTAPQPLLDAFAAAGTIRAATIYGPNGEKVAASGTASPDVEQIFRSLPNGGSLSVEPRAASGSSAGGDLMRNAAIAAACAALIALIAASLIARAVRRRFDAMRASVDDAFRDQTYATRVQPESGALRPLSTSLNKLLEQMQQRDTAARRRTTELEEANKDLESFAATVSHDLRAPIGSISGFAQALDEDYGPQLDDMARECIYWIRHSATQMNNIIEGMLQMARLTRVEVHRTEVDITRMARDVSGTLQRTHPDRDVQFVIPDGIIASGDERLLRAVLENLIGNAFKFTSKRPGARIEIGARDDAGTTAFYVRDNGAGFAPEHAAKMFRPFQRLHSEKEFSGTGIGLATVHRIVQRHGGRVWAEGETGKGATVYFTTGSAEEWAA